MLFVVLFPGVARAQDQARVGLTMGYPASIGVLWQMADRVAVRPEISITRSTGETSANGVGGGAPLSSDDSTGVGAGISALFYVSRFEGLRTYVSPRFSYTRTSTSASTAASASAGPATADSTVSAYSGSGSFGAQYALGRHFGLFGEIGLAYTRTNTAQTSTFTVSTSGGVNPSTQSQAVQSNARSNTVATRSGIGVIVFF